MTLKNLHVPLPAHLYDLLRIEAKKLKKPATVLVRQAIGLWLKEKHKNAIHEDVTQYALEFAGSELDWESGLENS